MAIRESLELDISQALNQLDDLERQLDGLFTPVARGDDAFSDLNRELDQTVTELRQVDNQAERTGRELEQTGRRGSSAFVGLSASLVGFAGALAAFGGVQVIGRGIATAIDAASDLEESLSKTNVVFGTFSQRIQDFAADAPEALGLSTQAALEATSTFGNLFVALGLTQEAATDLAPDIVQLASDLASFNNIPVGEAIEKLRAGLVGEAEPLRVLGVNLNEAATNAKALELGLVDASGAVTDAGKVQARYALILEQTATAQGDFARTAEGVANRQRTLNAEFENLQAAIGEALLPAFEALLDAGPALVSLIESLIPAVQDFSQAFVDVVGAIQPFLDNLTQIQQGIGAFSDAFGVGQAAIRQSVELFGSLASLRFGDFVENLGEARDVLGDFTNRLQDRASIFGLAQDLAEGADASDSFITRIREVAEQNDITSRTFETLASVAGLSGDALIESLRTIRENADAFDLDAQAVQFLNTELKRLLVIQQGFTRRQPGGGSGAPEIREEISALEEEQRALELLGAAADDAGVSLFDFISSQSTLTPELQAAVDVLDTGTLAYLRQVDAIDELQGSFDILPGSLTAAQDALKDAEGNIVKDFDTFIANLFGTLEEQEQFELDLATLRLRGQDALAAVFEDAGIEARDALAGAVNDPAGAGIVDARLLGLTRDAGGKVVTELSDAIAGMPVTQSLIDNLIEAAEQADSPTVRSALLALAEALAIEIPVTLGPIPGVPEFLQGTVQASSGGGGVVVNINQPTTTDLVTDANRAAQIIGNVAGARVGAQ